MNGSHQTPAVNPLPPIVVALFLILIGIELVFQAGERGLAGGPTAIGWRLAAMQSYAFSADIFGWMLETGRYPGEHLIRFVSYPFVHASFTQALFAGVILLAMGKMVGETFGTAAMLTIFFVSGIGAALVYALAINSPIPLIGAFPPIYGLIGGFTYMLWKSLSRVGENQARAFTLIGFLMGIQLVFGLFFSVFYGELDHTWVADLTGFAIGFGMSFFLSPGGWQRLRGKIRHD